MRQSRTALLEHPFKTHLNVYTQTHVRDRHTHDNAEHVNLQSDRNENGEDEYGLLVAMIEGAMHDAQAPYPVSRMSGNALSRFTKCKWRKKQTEWRTNRDEARTWLLQEQDPQGHRAFSFHWCCQALGWESTTIRARLQGMLSEVTPRTVEAA